MSKAKHTPAPWRRTVLEKLADINDPDTQTFEGITKIAKEALKQQ